MWNDKNPQAHKYSEALTVMSGDRLLKLREIIRPDGPLPIGRTTWLLGVKAGRYPAPVRVAPRRVAWRASDIAKLICEGLPKG